jgi:hypothetical protein
MTEQSRVPRWRALEKKRGAIDRSQDKQAMQMCSEPFNLLKRYARIPIQMPQQLLKGGELR